MTIEAEIWSTNPLERLNKELKRRCRVVGIFPTEGALVRLAGSVLIDVHEEWVAAEPLLLGGFDGQALSRAR